MWGINDSNLPMLLKKMFTNSLSDDICKLTNRVLFDQSRDIVNMFSNYDPTIFRCVVLHDLFPTVTLHCISSFSTWFLLRGNKRRMERAQLPFINWSGNCFLFLNKTKKGNKISYCFNDKRTKFSIKDVFSFKSFSRSNNDQPLSPLTPPPPANTTTTTQP